ncbi:MAG: amidase [Bacteroidetes bacterium]|nr:amidase [Bacteroidota bacterium]
MDRRNFLKNSSLLGLSWSASALPSVGFAGTDKDNQYGESFELQEATIDMLQQKMQTGQYSAVKLTKLYLQRIAQVDKSGPKLNSVIELNPDALSIAANLDLERKAGKLRGPLHGIPILIKDNIDTGDKMMTTAGSLALVGNKAGADAFIVKKLREAGAVLLGKTNLSEFANFRSDHSTSGWSGRGGQTKCPYILDRNPSGSSAGSGAAVSANLCAIAIGTETDGSIVSPSSVNGIVGIKPTVGLWSRTGIIPISKTQDTAGPMARTVKDAAILLSALQGIDVADEATKSSDGKSKKDYTSFLDIHAINGKRIGIEKSFLKGHEGVVHLYKNAISVLKKMGAEIIEVDLVKSLEDPDHAEFKVLEYEFKDGLNKYLAHANVKVKSLSEVIAFNKQHEAKSMPYFKQEILESSELLKGLDDKNYLEALQKSFFDARKLIDEMMVQYKLDAIAGPTNGFACCIDLANGDYDTGFGFSTPAARAGYPHITVPMGFVDELPIGFSFFGGAYTEATLIAMAYAFEQATKSRRAPRFLSPFDLY